MSIKYKGKKWKFVEYLPDGAEIGDLFVVKSEIKSGYRAVFFRRNKKEGFGKWRIKYNTEWSEIADQIK